MEKDLKAARKKMGEIRARERAEESDKYLREHRIRLEEQRMEAARRAANEAEKNNRRRRELREYKREKEKEK